MNRERESAAARKGPELTPETRSERSRQSLRALASGLHKARMENLSEVLMDVVKHPDPEARELWVEARRQVDALAPVLTKLVDEMERGAHYRELGIKRTATRRDPDPAGAGWSRIYVLHRQPGESNDDLMMRAGNVIEALGLHHSWQGAGRPFTQDAYVRVGRTRARIRWSGGWDI